MRSLSLQALQSMYSQETGEVAVVLLTIEHPSLAMPLRFSSNPTQRLSDAPLRYGTTSRGNTFDFLPFTAQLPDEKSEQGPQTKLVLDNIDREAIKVLRSTATPATVDMEIVLASTPDVVEVAVPQFDLVGADYDESTITIDLQIDAFIHEPFPAGIFSPAYFPGLF